jgi:hypothetical protein
LSVTNEMMIRRYLLGIANEAEEREVDDAVLAGKLDSAFLAESEDELIDAYCLDRLSAEERRRYIDNFLVTAERREGHAFQAALTKYLRNQQLKRTSRSDELSGSVFSVFERFWKPVALIAAAACAVLVLLAALGFREIRRDRQDIAESRNELARMQAGFASGSGGTVQQKEGLPIIPDNENARTEQMPVFEIASATRSIDPLVVYIPASVRYVGFEVTLPPRTSEAYLAQITQARKQIWVQQFSKLSIPQSGRCISFVPISSLPPGTYHFQFGKVGASELLIDQVLRVKK